MLDALHSYIRQNHLAIVALFVALGGTSAYAAATIGSSDIEPNAVRSKHIKNGQVKSPDVTNDNLRGVDLRDGTIEAIDVAFGTLRGDEIQDGTLSSGDVADDSLSGDDIGPNSLTGSDIQESSLAPVPRADYAFNAERILGQLVVPLSHFGVAGSGPTTRPVGALTLQMSCDGVARPRLQATTSDQNAKLWSLPNATDDDDFDTTETHDVIAYGDARGSGTAVYWVAGRKPVTISVAYSDLGTSCIIAGRAIG